MNKYKIIIKQKDKIIFITFIDFKGSAKKLKEIIKEDNEKLEIEICKIEKLNTFSFKKQKIRR